MKKTCLIHQQQGVGDLIFIQKIVKQYSEDGFNVICPILNQHKVIRNLFSTESARYPLISDKSVLLESFDFAQEHVYLVTQCETHFGDSLFTKPIDAGDFVFLTGQVPFRDGEPMTDGTIEDQTRAVLDQTRDILAEAGCTMGDVVKAMVWLRERADFPGFNAVYGEYFPEGPPARSAVVSELLVDVRVEVEVVAYDPQ